MKRDDMTYEELIDWIAGRLLTALIGGSFRAGVALALQQHQMWLDAQEKKK